MSKTFNAVAGFFVKSVLGAGYVLGTVVGIVSLGIFCEVGAQRHFMEDDWVLMKTSLAGFCVTLLAGWAWGWCSRKERPDSQ